MAISAAENKFLDSFGKKLDNLKTVNPALLIVWIRKLGVKI